MVSRSGDILEGEKLSYKLQVENLTLDSCKDSSSTATIWKAEHVSAEAHGCRTML